jgi:hypothetical protein
MQRRLAIVIHLLNAAIDEAELQTFLRGEGIEGKTVIARNDRPQEDFRWHTGALHGQAGVRGNR